MTAAATTRDPGFLDAAERHLGRRLACRGDIEAMLRAASDPALAELFDRALFLARFWEGATGILRRTGPGAEEAARLTVELAAAVTEVSEIVARLLASGAPERDPAGYRPGDLAGMGRLAILLGDLAA